MSAIFTPAEAAPVITRDVRPYPSKPLLSHTLVLDNTPQQLADKLTAQTQHERIAEKLEALFQEVDGLINDLPKQYHENAFATAEALDTARVAWNREAQE